jgi:MarR family transcriptional regulator, negative regulator of the multidrug operon emrRAB
MYDTCMQLENTLGALALAIEDRVEVLVAERAGIGRSSGAALASLSVRGGMSIERLRRILGLSHSACVRLIDRLEVAGLARRAPGPDRRAVQVILTEVGERQAEAVFDARADVVRDALAPLIATERHELEQLVARMLAALTDDRTSARHICRLCDHVACRAASECPVDAAATERER